jgi:GNAT superfamily N-acetyltransferase
MDDTWYAWYLRLVEAGNYRAAIQLADDAKDTACMFDARLRLKREHESEVRERIWTEEERESFRTAAEIVASTGISENAEPLLQSMLDNVNTQVGLAYDDEQRPVAAAIYTHDKPMRQVYVRYVGVLEAHRKQGHATRLMNRLQEEHSECSIELVPATYAPWLLDWYRSFGFRPWGWSGMAVRMIWNAKRRLLSVAETVAALRAVGATGHLA